MKTEEEVVQKEPLFEVGRLFMTPGAKAALTEEAMQIAKDPVVVQFTSYLVRHTTGDFGTLCAEDVEANHYAIKHGLRILSAYVLPKTDVTIWIITEADRASTTILLPEEY